MTSSGAGSDRYSKATDTIEEILGELVRDVELYVDGEETSPSDHALIYKATVKLEAYCRDREREARIDEIYVWFDKKYVDEGSKNMSISHSMNRVKKRIKQLSELRGSK